MPPHLTSPSPAPAPRPPPAAPPLPRLPQRASAAAHAPAGRPATNAAAAQWPDPAPPVTGAPGRQETGWPHSHATHGRRREAMPAGPRLLQGAATRRGRQERVRQPSCGRSRPGATRAREPPARCRLDRNGWRKGLAAGEQKRI
eukprot:scaffold23596_cov90-Isochrysis_galbana.AAC.2